MQAQAVNELDSPACRELRRKIQAIRIKRLRWSNYVFHYVMNGLGYGESLRALDEGRLRELWDILKGYRKHGRPAAYNYDKQGRYMHYLMIGAGWSEQQLRAFMIVNWKKTHWNLLDTQERQELIRVLQSNQRGSK